MHPWPDQYCACTNQLGTKAHGCPILCSLLGSRQPQKCLREATKKLFKKSELNFSSFTWSSLWKGKINLDVPWFRPFAKHHQRHNNNFFLLFILSIESTKKLLMHFRVKIVYQNSTKYCFIRPLNWIISKQKKPTLSAIVIKIWILRFSIFV